MLRPRLPRACLAVALLLAAASARAGDLPFRLLTPFSGAVVHGPEVLVVFGVAPNTKVLLHLDGKAVEVRDVPVPGNDEDLHHLRVPLAEGRRSLRILDAATEAELGSLNLTFIPPSSLKKAVGKSDKPYSFHTREKEGTCKGCHNLPDAVETVPDRPLAPAGKVCGACHPSIEKSRSLHGPVAVYECFKCHGADYTPSRFAQKTSQAALCGSCHQDYLTKLLGGSKFVHGPVAAGVCIVCHDPHGGRDRTLVREVTPDLCLDCHAETVPLPVEKSLHGKVPCTKCHDAHGGATEKLLPSDRNGFCLGCHANIIEGMAGHPIPGHPVEADADPSKPGQAMGCRSCHAPHGMNDVSKANIQTDVAAQRQFCRRCHY